MCSISWPARERVPALLLCRRRARPAPAVLLLHGFSSSKERMAQSVGRALLAARRRLARARPPLSWRARRRTREIPYRNPLALVAAWRRRCAKRAPRSSGSARSPEVDAGRIGIVGYSLGGFLALMTASEEPRVCAVTLGERSARCALRSALTAWTDSGMSCVPRRRAQRPSRAQRFRAISSRAGGKIVGTNPICSTTHPCACSARAYSPTCAMSISATMPCGRRDACDLGDGALAVRGGREVVDREARHDTVDARVGERQRAHVAVADLHSVTHAFGLRVGEGRGGAVVRLIACGPEVDADGATGREMLRRADEQQPVAAADVEHRLVAAEIERPSSRSRARSLPDRLL